MHACIYDSNFRYLPACIFIRTCTYVHEYRQDFYNMGDLPGIMKTIERLNSYIHSIAHIWNYKCMIK